LVDRFAEKVLVTRIRENIRLAEAPSFKKNILQYQPSSSVAQDFRQLAREVISYQTR
jgi:chromosome partitioning protein